MTRQNGRLGALPLAGSTLDRASETRDDALLDRLLDDSATRVLEVSGGRVRLTGPQPSLVLRAPGRGDRDGLAVFLGRASDGADVGTAYVAVEVDAPPDAPSAAPGVEADVDVADGAWRGLREVGLVLDLQSAGLVTEAASVLAWHRTHPRCPRCGEATVVVQAGWVRRCPADGSEHYPRTDPAVIMSVVDDDDRVLLGSHSAWPVGRFSTLAGFVEPGEPLEAAVRREVMEEVGVEVGDVTYLGSQPWPFPASLMLGFRAQALTTEIRVDGVEIAQARWFGRDELSAAVSSGELVLPNRLSISRALVEEWFGGRLEDLPVERGGTPWR